MLQDRQDSSKHDGGGRASWVQRMEQARALEAERREEWNALDRRLRAVAKERCTLDAKEAELLRDASHVEEFESIPGDRHCQSHIPAAKSSRTADREPARHCPAHN